MPRADSSLESAEGTQSCQHLDVGLLIPKTMKEYLSVRLICLAVCGNLFSQSQEMKAFHIWSQI
jgi:hypothetical protein